MPSPGVGPWPPTEPSSPRLVTPGGSVSAPGTPPPLPPRNRRRESSVSDISSPQQASQINLVPSITIYYLNLIFTSLFFTLYARMSDQNLREKFCAHILTNGIKINIL